MKNGKLLTTPICYASSIANWNADFLVNSFFLSISKLSINDIWKKNYIHRKKNKLFFVRWYPVVKVIVTFFLVKWWKLRSRTKLNCDRRNFSCFSYIFIPCVCYFCLSFFIYTFFCLITQFIMATFRKNDFNYCRRKIFFK